MAETSTKARRTVGPRAAKASDDESKLVCHVSDKVETWAIDNIRSEVCVSDMDPFQHDDGKHYCLFHLPDADKDNEGAFTRELHKRFAAAEATVAEAGELPEKECDAVIAGITYDFRYVWFPSGAFGGDTFSTAVNFSSATFSGVANFRSATFSGVADFSSATFSGVAYFGAATFSGEAHFSSATFSHGANFFTSATFSSRAHFTSATFSGEAYFISATFSGETDFRLATFSGDAFFESATFPRGANFGSATFLGGADFRSAIFSGDADFWSAKFLGETLFDYTEFGNNLEFNSAVFGKDSKVFFRQTSINQNIKLSNAQSEGYLQFSNLRLGKEITIDLQEAAFEKASRISFHTVVLCPNWFVNVDARQFVFTDVFWRNLVPDLRNSNIQRELDSLADRGIKDQKKRLFEIAARQLAVNAEENNRYDEAARFRYMAMETRRLETKRTLSPSRLLTWAYKWSSGYGESWGRAFCVLFAIWLVFAMVYYSVQGFGDAQLNFWGSFSYSLSVMAFQRPEPRPIVTGTIILYVIQTALGAVQAALLALAIRRKFMR